MMSTRSRIAAPFVVAGLIGAGALLPSLRAAASPDLPAITPQHLVEKVLSARVSHFSGAYVWRADLGLPSLSGLTSGAGQSVSTGSGFDPTSLLSGTHTFDVWVDGATRQRIAAPGTLSETDVVRRGDQAWVYDSSTDHVTHYVLRSPGRSLPVSIAPGIGSASVTALADDVLARVDSIGSDITVHRAVEVAGRAAYMLAVAPKRTIAVNRTSTVSAVTIAVDAKTGLPLRVSIYAVGQSSPAIQVGFSSISFATPSSSVFAVPRGQTTSTKLVGPTTDGAHGQLHGRAPSGSWIPGDASRRRHLATSRPGVGARWANGPVSLPAHPMPTLGRGSLAVGHSWGAIANLSSGRVAAGGGSRELQSVSTLVTGRWGTGRLITSTLVNALFLANGRVLVGAVTPAALEAAAARLPH